MVRTSGDTYVNLVHGILCRELPAESFETRWKYIINHVHDLYSGGSETVMSRRSWIQMIIHRNCILAANKGCMHFLYDC